MNFPRIYLCILFTFKSSSTIKFYCNCDNKTIITMTKNLIFHGRTKYIEILYYFIWNLIAYIVIAMKYHGIDKQITDTLTKSFQI